jgi:beta-glucosidase
MDNYEWAKGYTAPFGLFKTNFDSLARTPKASAFWVKEFMATQRKDMTADTSEVQ